MTQLSAGQTRCPAAKVLLCPDSRTGRLRLPFAYCLGTVALYHHLSRVGGQEKETAALRSASETGRGHRPAFKCPSEKAVPSNSCCFSV